MAGFIFSTEPIRKWRTVSVSVPTDRGFAIQEFELLMEACTNSELKELHGAAFGAAGGGEDDRGLDFLARKIRDWRGVRQEGEDGKTHDLAFSEESLRALLDIPYVLTAVLKTYVQFASGARQKN